MGKSGVCLGAACLVALCVGCVPALQSSAPQLSGDVLLGSELSQFRTVYEAVETLRNSWLSGHQVMACRCEPVVYVNGSKVRGLDVLRSTPPMTGVVVKHLSAREAAARFGAGHEGGAILVEPVRLLLGTSELESQARSATSIPSRSGTIAGIQRLSA